MRLDSIMNDFIESDDYLDLRYSTDKYRVSKRTIQSDLSYLMNISGSKGFRLHTVRSKGYLLEVIDQERFREFVEELSRNRNPIPAPTVSNLAACIAMQKDYISMEEISLYFDLSRTAVKNMIGDVVDYCARYNANLSIRSHYGLIIDKQTPGFVLMLVDLLGADNQIVKKQREKLFPFFKDIYSFLIDQVTAEHQQINYNELKNLYLWLEAACLQSGLNNNEDEFIPQTSNHIERIATNVFHQLENLCQIRMNEQQYQEFLLILRTNIRFKDEEPGIAIQLEQDIDEFLKAIDERYSTRFSQDIPFQQMLLEHVRMLVSRSHNKISYKNPLLNEICIRYPLVFSVAIEFANMLDSRYGISVSQDEAAFIATHFAGHMEKEKRDKLMRFERIGVVCSGGGGCAYLLKMQLESIFPKRQIETFSFLEMDALEAYEPDIIFTIMPLSRSFNIPTVYIHELLEPEDLNAIRNFLSYDGNDLAQLRDSFSKYDPLFDKKHFQIRTAQSYRDLIGEMAQELEEEGIAEPGFKDNVLEREAYMSTVFFNGIAMPHPIKLSSRKSLVSVCILEEPLMEQDKEVAAVFLFALRKDDYSRFEDLSKLLYRLMQDKQRSKRLRQVRSFEQMRVILKETEELIS